MSDLVSDVVIGAVVIDVGSAGAVLQFLSTVLSVSGFEVESAAESATEFTMEPTKESIVVGFAVEPVAI